MIPSGCHPGFFFFKQIDVLPYNPPWTGVLFTNYFTLSVYISVCVAMKARKGNQTPRRES